MADKGFKIEEDLISLGVKLNIPPFLRGRTQFKHGEATSLIHVERAMECIKTFTFFIVLYL